MERTNKIEIDTFKETHKFLNGSDFNRFRAIRNTRNPLIIYKRNLRLLLIQLKNAETLLESNNFGRELDRNIRWNHHKDLSTSLFNFLSSMGATIDLSRKNTNLWLTNNNKEKIKLLTLEYFENNISNKIIRKLRNVVLHAEYLNVGMVKSSSSNGKISKFLYIDSRKLLQQKNWNKIEREFLASIEGFHMKIIPMLSKFNQDFLMVQNEIYRMILIDNIDFLSDFESKLRCLNNKNNAIGKIFWQADLFIRYLQFIMKKIEVAP